MTVKTTVEMFDENGKPTVGSSNSTTCCTGYGWYGTARRWLAKRTTTTEYGKNGKVVKTTVVEEWVEGPAHFYDRPWTRPLWYYGNDATGGTFTVNNATS